MLRTRSGIVRFVKLNFDLGVVVDMLTAYVVIFLFYFVTAQGLTIEPASGDRLTVRCLISFVQGVVSDSLR